MKLSDAGRPGRHTRPTLAHAISSCGFFLKRQVYAQQPETIERLEELIIQEAQRIPQVMLAKVVQSFQNRLRAVATNNGPSNMDAISSLMLNKMNVD